MKRRDFIRLACGASVLAAPTSRAAWAVEPHKMYRLAMLHPSHPVSELTESSRFKYYREFFHELRQLGYIEGKNFVVERYSGEGRIDHYPELAREAAARSGGWDRTGRSLIKSVFHDHQTFAKRPTSGLFC